MKFKKLFLSYGNNLTIKQTALLALIVYVISVVLHLILYYEVKDNSLFYYDGRIMPIWTDDAAHFGYVAKQILQGIDIAIEQQLLPYIIAYSSKYLGIHIDSVMYFLPAILATTISIPIFLLLAKFRLPAVGFFAAIVTTILPAYYVRTHLGYTDTDILIMPIIIFFLYGNIGSTKSKNLIYPFIGSLSILFLYLSYAGFLPIVSLLIAISYIYALVFKRDNINLNKFLFSSITTLAFIYLFNVSFFIYIVGIAIILAAVDTINENSIKKYGMIFITVMIFIALFVLQDKIMSKIDKYEQRNDTKAFSTLKTEHNQTLYFFDMFKTVEEAKSVDINKIIKISAINKIAFYISILGLILLAIRHKAITILLAWTGISFWMSYRSGIRFTYTFAPILPIGFFYLFYFILQHKIIKHRIYRYILLFIFIIGGFYTIYKCTKIIQLGNKSLSPKYFTKEDIHLLDIINKKEVKKGDYVISWWDYGHMLKYYTNMIPYVDNGIHSNEDLYMLSKMFMSPNQNFMYNSSKFLVDNLKYNEKRVSDIFKENDYTKILSDLYQNDFNKTKDTANIFIYIPDEIIRISNTIRQFSARDLSSKKISNKYMNKIQNGIVLDLKKPEGIPTEGISFNPNSGVFRFGKETIEITAYREIKKDLKIVKKSYKRDKEYNYFVIKYKDRFFIAGKLEWFDNSLFRLLFFDMYDSEKFEMLGRSNNSTILKLK